MNYNLNEQQEFYEKCRSISIKICMNSLKIFFITNGSLKFRESKDKISSFKGLEIMIDSIKFYAKIQKALIKIA
jgi:hypothetical protein